MLVSPSSSFHLSLGSLSPFPLLFCLSIQSAIGHLSLSLSLSFNLAHDKSSTFDLSRVACPPFLHASYPFRFSIPPPPSLSPPFLGRSTFASFNSTCLSFFSFFFSFFFSLPPRCPLSPFSTSRCPDSDFYTFLRRRIVYLSSPPIYREIGRLRRLFRTKNRIASLVNVR